MWWDNLMFIQLMQQPSSSWSKAFDAVLLVGLFVAIVWVMCLPKKR